MIARDMTAYSYYKYGAPGAYGQATLIKGEDGEPAIQGAVTLAIYSTSQSIQDNINYKDCSYIGLTFEKDISDLMVIQYGDEKLKVQNVIPGRLTQVFLKKI